MHQTSILTIQLLDLKIKNDPDNKLDMYRDVRNITNEHLAVFTEAGIDPDIFHNDDIKYSGIQLSRHKGAAEWTAIGTQEVKALKLWYNIIKEENKIPLNNTVEIIETYTPEFLNYLRKYRIRTLLISDDLAKELNDMKDKFARYDRLEKYLYGNIQRFMIHIAYEHSKEANFLKVVVTDLHYHDKAHKVYHDQKKTAVDVRFECNFLLPQTVRLGQSTALGYGKVNHV